MYYLTVPLYWKDSAEAETIAIKGAPDRIWQSEQWHITTLSGSTLAENFTAPQWQAPSINISCTPQKRTLVHPTCAVELYVLAKHSTLRLLF